jgi:hypothetical protein
MAHKVTKIAFDSIVLFNMILLLLDGVIDDELISQGNDVTTVVLLSEIFLQVISQHPSTILLIITKIGQSINNKFTLFESLIIIINFVQMFLSNTMVSD